MIKRLKLHGELVDLLGTRNVYFQPPESIKIRYPAIVYSRERIDEKFADNGTYNKTIGYKIVVIDEDPDSEIVEKVSNFIGTRFVTHYTSDGLNHDVFSLNY